MKSFSRIEEVLQGRGRLMLKLFLRTMPRLALTVFALTVPLSLLHAASDPSPTTLSPGPSGWLLDRDYRIPVIWLTAPGAYSAGNYSRWLPYQGIQRFYEVHIPPQYKNGHPAPVVIVLHGGGGFPGAVRYESRMDEVSDRHGFIVVYPAGTGSTNDDRKLYWNSGPQRNDPKLRYVDDVGFIIEVLHDLRSFFTLDDRRIFATGISNGAQMSFRLAAEAGDRIAAIGPVAGEREVGQFFAPPVRAIPIILFHGERDTYLPYHGGPTPAHSGFEGFVLHAVPDIVLGWVHQNRGIEQNVLTSHIGQAKHQYFAPRTADGAAVEFWTLADGGHTWPGGRTTRIEDWLGVGHVNQDIAASDLMWEFFQRHPLPVLNAGIKASRR